ncbi:MAG: DUF2892 domain-containing protein [candidate division Zixibacteria bacterium]|nr:DUF2892 domain-containing protein [candidate division Zixibacteria bacterium]
MTLELAVRMLAGTLILFSLVMYYFVSPWWLLLTAFVGLNLFQSSLTKWCLAEKILKKLFFSSTSAAAR